MKKQYYPQIGSSPDFPKIEQKIIDYWNKANLFQNSVDSRSSDNQFVFYDGPPFANGLPHYGHLLTGFVKDTVARYQTMLGKKVERRFGWDCHGLPAEMGAEKELGISGRMQILEYGVDKFNEHCRSSVMKYTLEWKNYINRQARWVDFVNDYKTMDNNYMESVLWAFKELYIKGLVYESMRVMPYSWACETPLSNFETRLDNSYRQRADKAVTVKFLLKNTIDKISCKKINIIAWTTTPWTLPSNLALAINKDMDYCYVIKDDECFILAISSFAKYNKELGGEFHGTIKGQELIGLNYEPLMPYFKDHENSFVVLHGDFVTEGDGTGIVHLAPGFGEEDQILCESNNIKLVCPIDSGGKFISPVTDFVGKQVFDSIDDIIIMLKNQNKWLKTEQYIHNYPHCWRTDTPLIYRAISSWYVKVSSFKDRMVELNQQINWIPENIKDGLFGKWLENARDWSISRNRFWGTPIPIWLSDNPEFPRIDVYGSISELEQDFAVKITDLHKPFIDSLVRTNPDDPTGKSKMRRIGDVFDCWFDSGSMPYSQLHYPFENKEKFEKNFPADFIVEYSAQTRGWFYTLMVLSTALFDRPPFLNCICHGVILDDKGQKLSKRLQNYADPLDIFNKHGADAMRFLMLSSPVLKGNELLIDKEGSMIKDVLRLSIKPIWNSYHFFTLYANSDGIIAEFSTKYDNIMDKYLLAKVKESVISIKQKMDNYDISAAAKQIDYFFEILNNWYIRRNRARFWRSGSDDDKHQAYNALFTTLEMMCRASAPLLPLITEEIYLGVTLKNVSVHLQHFPDIESIPDEKELVYEIDKVREICSAALAIRNNESIRIRQPLAKLTIYSKVIKNLISYNELIKDELNVKEVIFGELDNSQATLKLKINFPILGKRLPHKVKDIVNAHKQNSWEKLDNNQVLIAGEVLNSDEANLFLEPKNLNNAASLPGNDGIVELDTNITTDLYQEGIARDLVRFVQQSRKEADFDIADKIILTIEASASTSSCLKNFIEYINEQTLSVTSFAKVMQDNFVHIATTEIENENITIGITKR